MIYPSDIKIILAKMHDVQKNMHEYMTNYEKPAIGSKLPNQDDFMLRVELLGLEDVIRNIRLRDRELTSKKVGA